MTKIILAVCLSAVAISALVFVSNTTGYDVAAKKQPIDSIAVDYAMETYAYNKYVKLDIIALLLASDERYLTEDNRDVLVAMQQYVQANPQLQYASRKTKIQLRRVTPFSDSTVYDASVEELDFNVISKIALTDESSSDNNTDEQREKLIQKFINVILTNDTLPTVMSTTRYAVVKSKCNLKIFPISN